MTRVAFRAVALQVVASLCAVALATAGLHGLGVDSPTTVALTYLLVVLFAASSTSLPVAVVTSLAAMLALNFFFMPPVWTFTIADSHNWVALFAFLIVAVVASHLSSTAQSRTADAVERRNEMTRLFDLSRDVLLTTDSDGATEAIAAHVARRFEVPSVTIALPAAGDGWAVTNGGLAPIAIPATEFDRAWTALGSALEFDGQQRSYDGQRTMTIAGTVITVVPVRIGVQPVGLVALGGRPIEAGTADAIAGIIAIAIERARFLDERRLSELARQRADLTSTLLAALGHDLRTPLTAIRVAVSNSANDHLDMALRAEQANLALSEIDHLSHLLQEILDMARIEAHAVQARLEWVTADAIVEAATMHAGAALARHQLVVDADDTHEVHVDPRLTSAALAHVLENAAKYAPPGTRIAVAATASADEFRATVSDEGPGLGDTNPERLFEPFVRGPLARSRAVGTGLGLAITRGLLAAEGGRIWAEASATGGARFTIVVPGARRPVAAEESWS